MASLAFNRAGKGKGERILSSLYEKHAKAIEEVRQRLSASKAPLTFDWTVDNLRLLKFVLSHKTPEATVAAVEQACESERKWLNIFRIAQDDIPSCEPGSGRVCDLWKLPEGQSAELDSVRPWHETLRKLAFTYAHEGYDADYIFFTKQGCKEVAISLCEAVNAGKVSESAFKAYVFYRVVREMCT